MLYSKVLGKTSKTVPKDEVSKNAQLLIKAGFIQKEMAGVYTFLPLGKRVLDKIIQIIREEMLAIGGQELFLSSLQNSEVWKKTNRWNDEVLDVWFKTALKNDTELGLAPTHEEPLATLMTAYIKSYKDLPVYVFQFQTKFRNELRAKSGLLRTREFIMKDLYSFHTDTGDLDSFYEKAKEAYTAFCNRLGIGDKTFITFASGGVFSKYSHEFQTLCENGEDTIYLDRAKRIAVNKEVYTPEVLQELELKAEELEEVSAIETGNIFKLGTRYSEPLGLFYTAEDGSSRPVVMGSYGVAPSRAMATIVELYNDDLGIVWPESVAPFKVHLLGIGLEDSAVKSRAHEVYEQFVAADVEVLFDDREEVSAGEKFADADLIGIPYRIVVSPKTQHQIEIKHRNETSVTMLELDTFLRSLGN